MSISISLKLILIITSLITYGLVMIKSELDLIISNHRGTSRELLI